MTKRGARKVVKKLGKKGLSRAATNANKGRSSKQRSDIASKANASRTRSGATAAAYKAIATMRRRRTGPG